MFTVIIQAANEAESYIHKAKIFLRRHFAEHDPKVVVRNAEAYDPKQHEAADAVLTHPQFEKVIAGYEDRDTKVLVAEESELDRHLAPEPLEPAAPPVSIPAPGPQAPASSAPAADEVVRSNRRPRTVPDAPAKPAEAPAPAVSEAPASPAQ